VQRLVLGSHPIDEFHALTRQRQPRLQLVHVERLEDHVGGAGHHELGERVVSGVAGDDQGEDVGLQPPRLADHRHAVRVRHVHVGHQQIEGLGGQRDERLG
jgi:hypothetical protein